MEIRKCQKDDVEAVYNLICELENKSMEYDKFCKAFNSKIENPCNYFLVAVEESIVGFISIVINYQLHHENKVATIEELIVGSNNRNKGIGKELLNKAIQCAKENECEVIELTSSMSRVDAHRFYERNNFTKGSYKFKMSLS